MVTEADDTRIQVYKLWFGNIITSIGALVVYHYKIWNWMLVNKLWFCNIIISIGAILTGHHYFDSGGLWLDTEKYLCHGRYGIVLMAIGGFGWFWWVFNFV